MISMILRKQGFLISHSSKLLNMQNSVKHFNKHFRPTLVRVNKTWGHWGRLGDSARGGRKQQDIALQVYPFLIYFNYF